MVKRLNTTTFRLREMLKDGANSKDVAAYLNDIYFPRTCSDLEEMARKYLLKRRNQGVSKNSKSW